MLSKLLVALAAVAAPAAAGAQASSTALAPPQVIQEVSRQDRYPAPRITFANGVTGVPDLIYSQPSGFRPLVLDLYLPPKTLARPPAGFPLVVYIHGGAWLAGDRHLNRPFVDFPNVLARLSARGYVVASVEYRLSGEAPFPAQIQDLKTAIRWIRSRAPDYGVDPSRAMTWGVSAGAYLAALGAVGCHAPNLEPIAATTAVVADPTAGAVSAGLSDCVQGAVAWYGVFDFATIADQARQDRALSRDDADAPEWRLLGCFASACPPTRIAAASPVTYVGAKTPPMLLIVGDDDRLVPYQQTLEMAERLKTAGVAHDLIVLPDIDHSLMGKTLEQTREANLRALDATFDFIDRTMAADR